MQREGADLNNMEVTDFLCDFCRTPWDGAFPMVEGHHGSLVCGSCLTRAYTEAVAQTGGENPMAGPCTMCLVEKKGRAWRSPDFADARICEPCITLAVTTLEKDRDWGWKRPVAQSAPAAEH